MVSHGNSMDSQYLNRQGQSAQSAQPAYATATPGPAQSLEDVRRMLERAAQPPQAETEYMPTAPVRTARQAIERSFFNDAAEQGEMPPDILPYPQSRYWSRPETPQPPRPQNAAQAARGYYDAENPGLHAPSEMGQMRPVQERTHQEHQGISGAVPSRAVRWTQPEPGPESLIDLEAEAAASETGAAREARRTQGSEYGLAAAGLRAQLASMATPETAKAEPRMHLWLWVAAILMFGFGDTFTSLLTFNTGGVEANPLLTAVLQTMGGSVMAFVLVKMTATVGVLLLSRLHARLDTIAATTMLATGVFLVGFNASQLM